MKILPRLFSLLAINLVVVVTIPVAAQETIFELPWTIGEAELDIPHSPATIKISSSQAIITGDSALDFERLGTGGFSFRAPAVVVNLNEAQNLLDNIYIQYHPTGYVSLENWATIAKPQVLARLLANRFSAARKQAPGGAGFRFAKWHDVPRLDEENETVYFAYEIVNASENAWINAKALKFTRAGLFEITWIGAVSGFDSAKARLQTVLSGLTIDTDQIYSQFQPETDKRAFFNVAGLITRLHNGTSLFAQQNNGGPLQKFTNGLAKHVWKAVFLLVVGAFVGSIIGWRKWFGPNHPKRRKKAVITIFGFGLTLSVTLVAFGLGGQIAIQGRDFLPDQPDTQFAESIVWRANREGRDVHITLMASEQPFYYRSIHGGQGDVIWQTALASYEKGTRVKLYYEPGSVPANTQDPIPVLAMQVGEETIHPLSQSVEGEREIFKIVGWFFVGLSTLSGAGAVGIFYALRRRLISRRGRRRLSILTALPTTVLTGILLFVWAKVEVVHWGEREIEAARTAIDQGKPHQALEGVETALSWDVHRDDVRLDLMNKKGEALYEIGLIEKQDERFINSIQTLEQILVVDAVNYDALKTLGNALVELGAYQDALRAFRKQSENGAAYWGAIRQAQVHRLLGRYDDAEDLYQDAYDTRSEWYGMPLNYHRAKNFVLQGEYDAAIASIERGLAYQEDYAWAYVFRACAKHGNRDIAGALDDYRQAVQVIQKNLDGGELGIEQQKVVAALAVLEASGERAINDAENPCLVFMEADGKFRERSGLLPDRVAADYLWSDLERQAGEGEPEAMFELAVQYAEVEDERLVPFKDIRSLMRRAAEAGQKWAQNEWGLMLQEGSYDTEVDLEESIKWFRLAAEQGDELASYNLGKAYRFGVGVEKDEKVAVEYFLEAAEREYLAAIYEAALIHEFGITVPLNTELAQQLKEKARSSYYDERSYWRDSLSPTDLWKKDAILALFDQYLAYQATFQGDQQTPWHQSVLAFALVLENAADLQRFLEHVEGHTLVSDDKSLKEMVEVLSNPIDEAARAALETVIVESIKVAAAHGNEEAIRVLSSRETGSE